MIQNPEGAQKGMRVNARDMRIFDEFARMKLLTVRQLGALFFCEPARNSGLIAFAFIVTATWLMPWYAGFMVVIAALSGSYLIVGATTGSTFVMLLLLPGSYQLPRELVPVLLLFTTLVLVVGLFFSAREGQGAAARDVSRFPEASAGYAESLRLLGGCRLPRPEVVPAKECSLR